MLSPFYKLLPLKVETLSSVINCWGKSLGDTGTTGLISRNGVGGVTNQEHMPSKLDSFL